MNKTGYIFAVALLALGLTAAGQDLRSGVQRYERVHKDNFWNGSRNVTGIRQDSVSRSFAELYAKYREGDLRQSWEAEQGWSAGAATASIRHLEKISFAGSFAFDHTEGYGMCGSMFIKPGLYPVDVLEFTPGRKTLQTYSFDGGVSYDVAPSWRIGAKMDFEAANIAKRKDLRHSNKRLDMAVAPGFMYHDGNFAIGASYIFEKTSESVEAEQVGTAESSYWAFLDKGLMYGVHSVWTGSGIHLNDKGVKGFPVNEWKNGAAVQMQYGGFFVEAGYMNTMGRIGEKEYIWFNFPGNSVEARAGYTFKPWEFRHNALVTFGWSGLGLDENVLERITSNGVETVLNHGKNRIMRRNTISFSPEYEAVTDLAEYMVRADFNWKNTLSSQMYPYIYGQNLFTYCVEIGMLARVLGFDFRASFSVSGGKVNEEKIMAAENSGVLGEPFRLTEWYEKDMYYHTVFKTGAFVSLRYNFRMGLYLEGGVDARCTKKGGPSYGEVFLKMGYNF